MFTMKQSNEIDKAKAVYDAEKRASQLTLQDITAACSNWPCRRCNKRRNLARGNICDDCLNDAYEAHVDYLAEPIVDEYVSEPEPEPEIGTCDKCGLAEYADHMSDVDGQKLCLECFNDKKYEAELEAVMGVCDLCHKTLKSYEINDIGHHKLCHDCYCGSADGDV